MRLESLLRKVAYRTSKLSAYSHNLPEHGLIVQSGDFHPQNSSDIWDTTFSAARDAAMRDLEQKSSMAFGLSLNKLWGSDTSHYLSTSPDRTKQFIDFANGFRDLVMTAALGLKVSSHCMSHAALNGLQLMCQGLPQRIERIYLQRSSGNVPGHAVLVVGRLEGSDPLNYKTWGNYWWLIDTWFNPKDPIFHAKRIPSYLTEIVWEKFVVDLFSPDIGNLFKDAPKDFILLAKTMIDSIVNSTIKIVPEGEKLNELKCLKTLGQQLMEEWLPKPDMTEKMLKTLSSSARWGVSRGTAKVAETALEKRGCSKPTSVLGSELLFYSLFLAMSYIQENIFGDNAFSDASGSLALPIACSLLKLFVANLEESLSLDLFLSAFDAIAMVGFFCQLADDPFDFLLGLASAYLLEKGTTEALSLAFKL
jgi:hypothetical protein